MLTVRTPNPLGSPNAGPGSLTIVLIAPKLLPEIAASVNAQVMATVLVSPQAQPKPRTAAPPRTQRRATA
jgi:hypothetical protein